MAGENVTLATFYENWKAYQDHIKAAVAPLGAEQLALRSAPNERTIGELAAHIIGCRAGWFTFVLKEESGPGAPEVKAAASWDDRGAPQRTGAELADGLDLTWQFMADRLARWTADDMQRTFEDDWEGKIVHLPRAWIVWHVMEHDLHHGGELALTLGMHGLPSSFPG
ncbi:MAG TPA: DinB family protein [Ktedonobacterales bacterium]